MLVLTLYLVFFFGPNLRICFRVKLNNKSYSLLLFPRIIFLNHYFCLCRLECVNEYLEMNSRKNSENQNCNLTRPRTSTFPGAPGSSLLLAERRINPEIFSLREEELPSFNNCLSSSLSTIHSDNDNDLLSMEIRDMESNPDKPSTCNLEDTNKGGTKESKTSKYPPRLGKKSSSCIQLQMTTILFLCACVMG